MLIKRDRNFDCSKCGLCCRSLGRNPIFRELGLDPGNGVCRFLDQATNLCTIDEDRPLICRVDDMYASNQELREEMSKSEWHKLNKKICEDLQKDSSKHE